MPACRSTRLHRANKYGRCPTKTRFPIRCALGRIMWTFIHYVPDRWSFHVGVSQRPSD